MVVNFLAEAPPVTYEDLEKSTETTEEDVEIIEEFETLWKDFLVNDPEVLSAGKKGDRIESIRRQIEVVRTSKQNVEMELQRQLDFFESSKLQLEQNFFKATTDATNDQEMMMDKMCEKIDKISTTSRNLEANGPWELFLAALEEAVDQADVKPLGRDGLTAVSSPRGGSNMMKPGARAMYLNNANEENCAPGMVRSRDFFLRAYRIDRELLKGQVKTLQREVERVEMTTETLDFVGKFMTAHNIWGLLTSRGAGTVAGTISRAPLSAAPTRTTN